MGGGGGGVIPTLYDLLLYVAGAVVGYHNAVQVHRIAHYLSYTTASTAAAAAAAAATTTTTVATTNTAVVADAAAANSVSMTSWKLKLSKVAVCLFDDLFPQLPATQRVSTAHASPP